MNHATSFVVAVLVDYAADAGGLDRLRVFQMPPDSSFAWLDQVSLVEGVAEATWRRMERDGVPLPPSAAFSFVARPFDDRESRLVICSDTALVINMLWPALGLLDDWVAAVTALAKRLRAFAAGLAPSGPTLPRLG